MLGYIEGKDFANFEAMKYYAPPSTWTDAKKKENARTKIYSGDWYGAEKKDGYFAKLVKDEDGNVMLFSRSRGVNGQFADKHEWIPQLQEFYDSLPNGTCFLGEVYFPSAPGSRNVTTIMGCLKEKAHERQIKGEKLHFYIFDCLAWSGKSWLDMCARKRFAFVDSYQTSNQYVSTAHYVCGQELWNLMQEILAAGGEGVVITNGDGKYEPGKRPSKTTLKIKKELKQTIDCFFTGRTVPATKEYTGKEITTWQFWESEITGEKLQGNYYKEYASGAPIVPITKGHCHGWAGSLEIGVLKKSVGKKCTIRGEIYEDCVVYPLGWLSGVTDEMKADVMKYAFTPIEVTAMEYDGINHTLRHGKMVGWRTDLTLKDCTFEKIEE